MVVSKISSVAVIGGGPSGAISLSSLVEEGVFDRIVLYERKSNYGGTWRADKAEYPLTVRPGSSAKELDIPLPLPEGLIKTQTIVRPKQRLHRWDESPAIYSTLRTNVPRRVMAFSDSQDFFLDDPKHDELTNRNAVEEYIVNYVNKYSKHDNVELKTDTSVEKIDKDISTGKYRITWKKSVDDQTEEFGIDEFDAIVVAVGHYNVPKIPDVEGIQSIYAKFPEKILHTKNLVINETFKGKKIIIVGSRSSSVDTIREAKKQTNDIIWSVKQVQNSVFHVHHDLDEKPGTERKPVISRFEMDDNLQIRVIFEDGSSAYNPDYIIYATGYHFSFPFLEDYKPGLTKNGIVENLYQHTFYINEPRLSFVGIPIDGMSFRVFEYQAILVARYLAGKFNLPSIEDQKYWHDQRLEKFGYERSFHTTGLDPALAYIDVLVQLGGGIQNDNGNGKEFPQFTERDLLVYEENKVKLTSRWSLL